ncbi:hypothetical protein F2P56_015196, partial [Juglans regia]
VYVYPADHLLESIMRTWSSSKKMVPKASLIILFILLFILEARSATPLPDYDLMHEPKPKSDEHDRKSNYCSEPASGGHELQWSLGSVRCTCSRQVDVDL